MSREVKYIGYPELEVADTMWPSGLCRGGVKTEPSGPLRVRIRRTPGPNTRHSLKLHDRSKALEKRHEPIIWFVAAKPLIA